MNNYITDTDLPTYLNYKRINGNKPTHEHLVLDGDEPCIQIGEETFKVNYSYASIPAFLRDPTNFIDEEVLSDTVPERKKVKLNLTPYIITGLMYIAMSMWVLMIGFIIMKGN